MHEPDDPRILAYEAFQHPELGYKNALCARGGGGVVGFNYLMSVGVFGTSVYRRRMYERAGVPDQRPRPRKVQVTFVDRKGQSRAFLNIDQALQAIADLNLDVNMSYTPVRLPYCHKHVPCRQRRCLWDR